MDTENKFHSEDSDKIKKRSKRDAETEETSVSSKYPQGYQVVPIDSWQYASNADDEIDLIELAKTLWEKRTVIIRFAMVGVILGTLFALISPKEYSVTTTLLPEYNASNQSGASSLLRQFGGLAGISGASLESMEQFPIALYPEIVKTLPFQLRMLGQPFFIPSADTTVTLKEYFTAIKEPDGLSILKKWTVGLPGMIFSNVFSTEISKSGSKTDLSSENQNLIYELDEELNKLINQLSERITVTFDNQSGIMTVSVQMPDPNLASDVARFTVDEITDYLTNYKTEKLNRDLEFTQSRLSDAKKRYEETWLEYASFQESIQGSMTARARKGEQFLQSEYNIAASLYQSLLQQYEQKNLEIQEQTPIFKILQPIQVPNYDDTKGSLIILIFIFLSIIVSLGYIFIGSFIKANT